MAAQTAVERQKQLYARELAAHTLRQWNTISDSNDGTKGSEADAASSVGTVSDDDARLPTDKNQRPHNPGGANLSICFAK